MSLYLALALLAGGPEDLAKLFSYDASAPLHYRIDGRETAAGAEILTVSFAGARAPGSASLVVPARPGKHAAVMFMSDSGHKRDQFHAEALMLAAARPHAVSLLIDAPAARPLGWRRSFNPVLEDNDRDIHIQAVVDARRGVDLLMTRTDVDARFIAYVGQSDAANWGAILSSIEPRLRAVVLIAGFPNLTSEMIDDDPELADLRYALGNDRFARYIASLSDVDPVRYLARSSGAPLLFQFGRFDSSISRARAEALAHATGRPEQAFFYDAGHEVNDPRALADRRDFLVRKLRRARVRYTKSQRQRSVRHAKPALAVILNLTELCCVKARAFRTTVDGPGIHFFDARLRPSRCILHGARDKNASLGNPASEGVCTCSEPSGALLLLRYKLTVGFLSRQRGAASQAAASRLLGTRVETSLDPAGRSTCATLAAFSCTVIVRGRSSPSREASPRPITTRP